MSVEPAQSTLKILHLSDIHFGFKAAKDGAKKPDGKPLQRNSTHYFVSGSPGKEAPDPLRLASLLHTNERDVERPDLLVISGDLGWSAASADYDYALKFCRGALSGWNSTRTLVVPGNHDVDLRDGLKSETRQSTFVAFLHKLFGAQFDRLYPLLSWPPASGLPERERLVTIQAVDERALVVGVNTAAHINEMDDSKSPINVSSDLLALIGRYISENPNLSAPDVLRIFVMHHHLLPFVEPARGDRVNSTAPPNKPDTTIVANSAQLQVWLAENDFDLVLHGHKHMPHGRSDRLWHKDDTGTFRHTAIVGAGSAGVSKDQIPSWHRLSLNKIDLSRIDTRRWNAHVDVLGIFPDQPGRPFDRLFNYWLELGKPPDARPPSFVSEHMDLCHQAIVDYCRDGKAIRNFTSIVTNPTFILPATARIGKDAVRLEQIENCFKVLHPEFDRRYGWGKGDRVHALLKKVPIRFAFQHGPRIFGIPGKANLTDIQPIQRALDALDRSGTRGYVSLVSTEYDVIAEVDRQPVPALVGLQFLKDGKVLDLVATFRALELSFWWTVNMYEACKILKWAASKQGMRAGSISFFAAQANWLDDPKPSFPTEIDQISVSDLANLAVATNRSDVARLRDMLIEKSRHTSVFELDPKGLRILADLLRMRAAQEDGCLLRKIANQLASHLDLAAEEIERAIQEPTDRAAHVEAAEQDLDKVVSLLSKKVSELS